MLNQSVNIEDRKEESGKRAPGAFLLNIRIKSLQAANFSDCIFFSLHCPPIALYIKCNVYQITAMPNILRFEINYLAKSVTRFHTTHTHKHTHTHTNTHTYTHTHTHARMHARTHSLTHSINHSLTHSLTQSLTQSLTHSLTHTHL